MWDFLSKKTVFMNEPNAVRVLRFVRQQEITSQTEIVKNFGLSKAAVSEVVLKLATGGYIQEVGMSNASQNGGRRRVLLKFNPLSGLVIGIDIRISSATVALADLNATILQKNVVKFSRGASPKEVIPQLLKSAEELLKSSPQSSGKLIGIGIGIPGVIDYSSGTLLVADTLRGWDGVSISAMFESYFGVPSLVENDVKAMTLTEYLLGTAKGVRDFVLIWIGNGIGAGIMVDGRLLRGATSSAGEIGYNELGFHISKENEFPLLYSGQRDFGDILSEDSIIDAYCRASGQTKSDSITIDKILEFVSKGDSAARDIFHEISRLIGIIGIMLVNTLNPKMILLGGNVINGSKHILEEVSQFLKKDILPAPVQNVRVEPIHHKTDEVLLGAIGLILYELFEPQPLNARLKSRMQRIREKDKLN